MTKLLNSISVAALVISGISVLLSVLNYKSTSMIKEDIKHEIENDIKHEILQQTNIEEIEKSIDSSIESKNEDPLIGLGVLFELMWNYSNNATKNTILSNIKKGLTN